jgi:hypothetical protein
MTPKFLLGAFISGHAPCARIAQVFQMSRERLLLAI